MKITENHVLQKANPIIFFAFILLFFTSFLSLFAQNTPRSLFVKHTNEKILIDGSLDEAIWQTANKADDFWQFFPTDSVKGKNPTQVSVLYSDDMIYVGVRAESVAGKFVVNSLRRDFVGNSSDNVSISFDTFSDGNNAFLFSVNPYGVQRETFISEGGANRDGFNSSWDVKWQAESKMFDKYYTIEIAIPFSSLKFPEGSQKWRFQTYRFDLQTNEQTAWNRVPQNQLFANLAFMGEMVFEKPLGKSRPPIYLIPYLNTIATKDYASGKVTQNINFGGDAKIALGNSMNLDVTVNPDFSNVEVDNIVTNLTRFEVSMPEKRQFFIDNNDLFGNFGNYFSEPRPFFSRRIGIVTDTLGNTIENKILGGVRLSGKLNKNWRLGLLNIQTAEDLENRIVSNNNAMFSLQRKLFSRSNIGVFLVNRQTFKDYDFQNENNKYNRVLGVDYNLASKNNVWSGRFYVHKSFQPNDTKGNLSAQSVLIYNTRFWNYTMDWGYVDKDFRADLGFVQRTDVLKSGNAIGRTFYSKSGMLNKQKFQLLNFFIFKPQADFKRTDQLIWLTDDIEFKSHATLQIRYMWNYIYLTRNFDPTRTFKGQALAANTAYDYNQVSLSFMSNHVKSLSYILTSTVGQFFNGKSYSFSGNGSLRIMPKALISLLVNYDKIQLPKPYSSADIVLISPKIDLTFTKSLFWSTLVQYSNQRNNLGVQSRLQWRFAPLSDLFLVYNDNYSTTIFEPKYRSINLKFTYWLNL